MPDLGKYADVVLNAYAAGLLLLVFIVALSLWQNARAKARLRAVEARRGRHG